MRDIAAILQQLPDDEVRLRVMRWAFGRFAAEFKRPVPPPLTIAPAPASAPAATAFVPTPLHPAPRPAAPAPQAEAATTDFGQQIAELSDLFPDRATGDIDSVPDPWHA